MFSNKCISLFASCCLRYWEATVTAVTWPCQDSPCPSTLPITETSTLVNDYNYQNGKTKSTTLLMLALNTSSYRNQFSGHTKEKNANVRIIILKTNIKSGKTIRLSQFK